MQYYQQRHGFAEFEEVDFPFRGIGISILIFPSLKVSLKVCTRFQCSVEYSPMLDARFGLSAKTTASVFTTPPRLQPPTSLGNVQCCSFKPPGTRTKYIKNPTINDIETTWITFQQSTSSQAIALRPTYWTFKCEDWGLMRTRTEKSVHHTRISCTSPFPCTVAYHG